MGQWQIQVWEKKKLFGMRYYVRIVGGNGEVVFSGHSKGYVNKADRDHAAACVQNNHMRIVEVES